MIDKNELDKINERKQKKIQSNNLVEEASELLENCIKCGLCKGLCPVFKVIREEKVSPRGKAIILQEKILNDVLFKCTLCKACEKRCPMNLKICDAILKAREAMVLREMDSEVNKEIVKEIKKKESI